MRERTGATRARRALLAVAIAAAIAGAGASTTQAALGDLSFANCIQNTIGAGPVCAGNTGTVVYPQSLVISPSGTSAYTAGALNNLITQYDRDPATGKLTYVTCWQDAGGSNCGGNTADGLGGVSSIAISPDGGSLYATGNADDALTWFDRAPNGDLSDPHCLSDEDTGTAGCGAGAKGLDGASSVAVTNASIYVSSFVDRAIAHFDRVQTAGIFFGSPLQDADDPCEDEGAPTPGPEDGCSATVPILAVPSEIAVTPNGANVYVADAQLDGVVGFDRATSGDPGDLSYDGCVEDGPGTDCAGNGSPSLNGASSLTISPDGGSLYATSVHDDAVVPLRILAGGGLQAISPCFSDTDAAHEGCTLIDGLGTGTNSGPTGPHAVGISPDGRSAYVASGQQPSDGDHALSLFSRDPASGSLSYRGCIRDTTEGIPGCGASFPLLDNVNGVVAADDSHVYTVGGAGSIVTFDRDLGAPQPPSSNPSTNPAQTAKTAKKRKCRKHKHKKHKRAADAKKNHMKKCKRKKKRRSA